MFYFDTISIQEDSYAAIKNCIEIELDSQLEFLRQDQCYIVLHDEYMKWIGKSIYHLKKFFYFYFGYL